MITKLIAWGAKKALNKYLIAGAVTLLLGVAGLFWHNFKQDLREEGRQVCIQVINEQTVIDLRTALAEERATGIKLRALVSATALENEEARIRLRESGLKVDALLLARKNQEETDELYKTWSNTTLPNGVAARLRGLRAGRDTGALREEGD